METAAHQVIVPGFGRRGYCDFGAAFGAGRSLREVGEIARLRRARCARISVTARSANPELLATAANAITVRGYRGQPDW